MPYLASASRVIFKNHSTASLVSWLDSVAIASIDIPWGLYAEKRTLERSSQTYLCDGSLKVCSPFSFSLPLYGRWGSFYAICCEKEVPVETAILPWHRVCLSSTVKEGGWAFLPSKDSEPLSSRAVESWELFWQWSLVGGKSQIKKKKKWKQEKWTSFMW